MIRVFPRRTKWTPNDELAFVGDPPLFRPQGQSVYISVAFTWDIAAASRLYRAWKQFYPDVFIGGPAWGGDYQGEFNPGVFLKEGVTITSRGCPWECPWCFVPRREGRIKALPIQPGWIVQDNNLLACSREHQEKVFEMLLTQKAIEFSGGLDGYFLSPWHIDWFKKLRVEQFWFACDHATSFKRLEKIADLMADFPEGKKRCYVMIGYGGESIKDAQTRLEKVYSMGFLPFSQLYRGEDWVEYSKEWEKLNRKWSRPAAYRRRRG